MKLSFATMALLLMGTMNAFATIQPEEPADFGPIPGTFGEYRTSQPLIERIDNDLANLESYREHRIEILQARIQLLADTVVKIREIARSLKNSPKTKELYLFIAKDLEEKKFPALRIHKDLEFISNPNSQFVVSLREFRKMAQTAADRGQDPFDSQKFNNLRSSLLTMEYEIFHYAKNFYAENPLKIFEEEYRLYEKMPKQMQKKFFDCSFYPSTLVRKDEDDIGWGKISVIDDSDIIALVLDGNSKKGIKPLDVTCGFRVIPRDFEYDGSKNHAYNYSNLDASLRSGIYVESATTVMESTTFDAMREYLDIKK